MPDASPPATPRAPELARRLVAREAAASDAPEGVAAAAHAACERAFRELSRWLGGNGSHALVGRALSQAQREHAVLGELHLGTGSETVLRGVPEAVQSRGASAVAAALEALLVELLELLGRLIGDDLAARLVERSVPAHAQDNEIFDRRSASS